MIKLQIKVEALSKRFNREWIFRDLTYEFQHGNVYAITGPNGSGKSTLLQILWGQMPPSSGSLSYHFDDKKLPDELIYHHVSVATPYMDLIDEFTLQEQVEFHFRTKSIRAGYSAVQVIEAMYLHDAQDKFISNFSSGMKQRVKLGLAFYTESDALFLDEPGTNLDQKAFDWYLTQLKALGNDKLIIIASNQRDEYPANAVVFNVSDFKPNSSVKI